MAQAAVAAPLLRRWCSHSSFSACKHRRFVSPFSLIPCFSRGLSRVWGLRPAVPHSSADESDWEEERYRASRVQDKKSKNELKREARRAVEWGMELAKFSPSQIKRAIRVASLEDDVYEALMLVKRMGADVREGKRRQFNYIGSLLRNAEPELMDALIKAYKDGDTTTVNSLIAQSQATWSTDEDKNDDDEEKKSIQNEGDEELYVRVASRWYEGLIRKDLSITNEVYSLHSVEFDRQELRKLVKRVQSVQSDDATFNREKRLLMRFLRSLAKKIDE